MNYCWKTSDWYQTLIQNSLWSIRSDDSFRRDQSETSVWQSDIDSDAALGTVVTNATKIVNDTDLHC